MSYADDISFLAGKLGIIGSYEDSLTNKSVKTPPKTIKDLLGLMGYPVDTLKAAEKSVQKWLANRWTMVVPPVFVVKQQDEMTVPIRLLASNKPKSITWVLMQEDGTTASHVLAVEELLVQEEQQIKKDRYQRYSVPLPNNLPIGYHKVSFLIDGVETQIGGVMRLVVAPRTCYRAEALVQQKKVFGIPLQLYSLRSDNNWGIGDFTDLGDFAPIAKSLGVDVVGVNPLSALFYNDPVEASPYFSSSRFYLNPLYIDVMDVPEMKNSDLLKKWMKTKEFKAELMELKASHTVQYPRVRAMKDKAFTFCFNVFMRRHLGDKITKRGQEFNDFIAREGKDLQNFACYHMLREYFAERQETHAWWNWPSGYRTPTDEPVQFLAQERYKRILFFKYLQFLAFKQLEKASAKYKDFTLGLYLDLPVSTAQGSEETWSNQRVFLREANIGAPPDMTNPKGQKWGLAPMNPESLWEEKYESFRKLIAVQMQMAGALRIDHVFSMMRLFWYGNETVGGYVAYPFDDLMSIVALESFRNKCTIVGEDLGTVPEGFHDRMGTYGVLSFRIFRFQRWGKDYMPPDAYSRNSLVTVGTHDMPTLSAFWKGKDLELFLEQGLIAKNQLPKLKLERKEERLEMMKALSYHKICFYPTDFAKTEYLNGSEYPSFLAAGVCQYLARSTAGIFMVSLEDIFGQDEQINLPGTHFEYPNWSYKLSVMLPDIAGNESVKACVKAVEEERKAAAQKINSGA